MNNLRNYISNHPDGFTINPNTMETPKKGFGVALKETQNSFGEQGLQKALAYALEHNLYLGGWLDERTKEYYYDATVVVETLEEAKALAKQNEQLAFYDFANKQTIFCD